MNIDQNLKQAIIDNNKHFIDFFLNENKTLKEDTNALCEMVKTAVMSDNLDVLKQLFLYADEQIEIVKHDALHSVCYTDHIDILDFILKQGVDINHKNLCEMTPILSISQTDDIDILDHLILHGANCHDRNYNLSCLRDKS